MVYSDISFNGVSLKIDTVRAVKKQKTVKQVIGRILVENEVVGISSSQWEISLSGIVSGNSVSNLTSNRNAIEALDDGNSYSYVDGLHDGTFVIKPESLVFDDDGDNGGLFYRYSMVLVEW